DLRQALVIDAEAVLDVGAEVLDHHVGLGHDALEHLDPSRVLQVEGHRPLVAMQVEEVEADRGGVAFFQLARLDLDDLGSHVGQVAHGGRAGPRPGEIDDGDVLEWQAHRVIPAGRMAEPVCDAGFRRGQRPASTAVRKSSTARLKSSGSSRLMVWPALGITTRPEQGSLRFMKMAGSRHGSSSSPVMMSVGTSHFSMRSPSSKTDGRVIWMPRSVSAWPLADPLARFW